MELYDVHLKKLLADLKELQTNGPSDPDLGICQGDINTNLLHHFWKSWPHFSGKLHYPIPHPDLEADEAFFEYQNLWNKTDPYCALRWELVDWLIDQIKIELSKT